MSNFIISCGGTGGHLAPGLAVGQSLMENGHKVLFVISKKDVDKRLVKKYGNLNFERTPGTAFSKNPLRWFAFFREFFKSVSFCKKLIIGGEFNVVISFGGFSSLGLSMAAILLKKPLVLHEANRKPGKATRLLGRFAKRVYVPFGVKIPRRKSGQVKYSGYPIRAEIQKLDPYSSREKFGFERSARVILVLGGSQGAAALNEWANNAFDTLAEAGFDMLCVCGQGKIRHENRSLKLENGDERKLVFLEFCDDMAEAMSASELAVARAGAGTIAEFARCSLPSIIVPYPYAADNHQFENAKCFEHQGACVVVSQNNIESLAKEAVAILGNERTLASMKKNLSRVNDLNDTSKISEDLSKIAAGEL